MKKIPVNNIITKIHNEKGLEISEINQMISFKVSELSGLVSEEGAAHIIANELGVHIFGDNELKIGEIMPNMKDITVFGKVTNLFDLVEFQKDSNPGKVRSLILADETGRLRVSFWHKSAEFLEQVNVGDILKLSSIVSRQNNGQPELSVTNPDHIEVNPEGLSVSVGSGDETIKIVEINPGPASILGTIVQVFKPNFYDRCPECGKKVIDGKCVNHGEVTSKKACIQNIVLDDGTGSMRCVFFNESAEKLTSFKIEEMEQNLEQIQKNLLGKIFKFSGNVRYSSFLNENEITVNSIEPIDFNKEKENLESRLNLLA